MKTIYLITHNHRHGQDVYGTDWEPDEESAKALINEESEFEENIGESIEISTLKLFPKPVVIQS